MKPMLLQTKGGYNKNKTATVFPLGWIFLLLAFLGGSVIVWQLIGRHHSRARGGSAQYHSYLDENGRAVLNLKRVPVEALYSDADSAKARNPNCSYWDCLNVYRCGHHAENRIAIYVYPLRNYVDNEDPRRMAFQMTKEYYYILKAIIESPYYTPNPDKACLFVPSLDLLNQNLVEPDLVAKALNALSHWEGAGENHLLFNLVPGAAPNFNKVMDVNTDRALIAGAGFDSWTYRSGFDVSMPLYSPLQLAVQRPSNGNASRKYLLLSSQLNIFQNHRFLLQNMAYEHEAQVMVLQKCSHKVNAAGAANDDYDRRCNFRDETQVVQYPAILTESEFCLVLRGVRLAQLTLLEAMAANCIPVIVGENAVLPFAEVIDWTLTSIRVREVDLHTLIERLRDVSADRRSELRRHGDFVYRQYFKSIRRIVHTTLDILNARVFPHTAKTYLQWNVPKPPKSAQNPLFLPLIAPKSQGFTAVILTYDRVESLFTLVQKLSLVPSLQKILVIWNNQRKQPPHPTMFPKVGKPLKVIQTKANKLSNRFYPYEEIETEAILTIDDDIVMLTADELDFGYEVWREFPDRIVGYPSRMHVWDNATLRWKYESEWTNQISMVLTGAAFHHKYWSHMYTNVMPREIRDFVDEHMNCEDIAMNFLVANITNKPPIKVAPRKKFKCPECTNTEMLSADLNHMMERTSCINRFAAIYGTMPLKAVEFRADPVLYKDNFPDKLKRFNDIGSL